jgi:hypothetical protein
MVVPQLGGEMVARDGGVPTRPSTALAMTEAADVEAKRRENQ